MSREGLNFNEMDGQSKARQGRKKGEEKAASVCM